MKNRKQSMREVRDAAAIDRAVTIVEGIGNLALEMAAERNAKVPGNNPKPQYFRGALVKSRHRP